MDRNYLETTFKIRDGFEFVSKMINKQKEFYLLLLEAFDSSEYVTTKMMTEYGGMPESTTRRYLINSVI